MSETTYDRIGTGYADTRRADPRIAARIEAALGDARSVVNIGAGAGSYEPRDREVTGRERLAADLDSGTWEARYGHLRKREELDVGLRLVVRELDRGA